MQLLLGMIKQKGLAMVNNINAMENMEHLNKFEKITCHVHIKETANRSGKEVLQSTQRH